MPSDIQALKRKAERLERMMSIGLMLNSTLDLSQLLETIIQTAADLLETEAASILLFDERSGELFFAAAKGSSREELRKIKVPIEGSIAGTVYKTGEPLIVGDVSTDRRHYTGVDQSISFQTREILAVPLDVRSRRIGVLEAINKLDGSPFAEADIPVLSTMASYAAVALENSRLVARLREANRRLSELDRLKTNFISIASHELRTPLMIVQGYASFLREQATGEMTEDLDMVLKGASKLQAIIDQMTNLNYLQAGTSEVEKEDVVLQTLVEEVCRDWRPLASAKAQGMHLQMPPTPISMHTDRDKVALVLNNLLNNAVKFTPEGGRIEVHVIPRTGRMEIAVIDTGIGIPEDEVHRIFDRFYQVEGHLTRHHGGLGLGLAIAKEVVEQLGGRIWAESVERRGSRVAFTVPALLKAEGA
jgi:signal transduction histidine kinase